MKIEFEIPINKEVHFEMARFRFDLAWRKNLKDAKNGIVAGICFLLLGGFLYPIAKVAGFTLIPIGVFYFYSSAHVLVSHRKKSNYFLGKNGEIFNKLESTDTAEKWTVTDESIIAEFYAGRSELKWLAFDSHSIIDDVIILNSPHFSTEIAWMLSPKEVSQEDYNSVKEVIQSKLELKKIL